MITRYIIATSAPMARVFLNSHLLCSEGACTEHQGIVFTDEAPARASLLARREDSDPSDRDWAWTARVWVAQSHTQQMPD